MVALGANWVSSRSVGVDLVCFTLLFSDRGDLSVLTCTERLRLLSREREWVERDLDGFDRDPRVLMKTRVGRVRGSMNVTCFATSISASSTE